MFWKYRKAFAALVLAPMLLLAVPDSAEAGRRNGRGLFGGRFFGGRGAGCGGAEGGGVQMSNGNGCGGAEAQAAMMSAYQQQSFGAYYQQPYYAPQQYAVPADAWKVQPPACQQQQPVMPPPSQAAKTVEVSCPHCGHRFACPFTG
jgi:hypothetical protein